MTTADPEWSDARSEPHEARQHRLERVLGHGFIDHNRIERLRNGDAIFPAMLEAIGRAERRIAFTTFIWGRGDVSAAFAHAFAERARAGVRVRVLVDAAGGWRLERRLVREMRAAGVTVRFFRPMRPWRPARAMRRTHRKLLIVDERVGFVGGVGIAWPWAGDARRPEEWRDSQFRCEGPIVSRLEAAFWGNWLETGAEALDVIAASAPAPAAGTARALVVQPKAALGWNDLASLTWWLCETAESRLLASTPYLAPDAATLEGLLRAARRGVDVQLMMPGPHSDHWIPIWAAHHGYERLVAAGATLLEYQPTMLHLKQIVVDDDLACIGSINLNSRSRRRDDEVAVLVEDRELARTLIQDFEDDRRRALPLTVEELARRGRWRRPVAALLRPLRHEV